jgi:hypothetical protein
MSDVSSFDFKPYSCLQTLLIPQIRFKAVCLHILTSIASKYLEHIVLFLPFSNDREELHSDSAYLYDWDAIDEAMASLYPSVKILLHINGQTPPTVADLNLDYELEIKNFLPDCAKRGVLEVYFGDAPIWEDLHIYSAI